MDEIFYGIIICIIIVIIGVIKNIRKTKAINKTLDELDDFEANDIYVSDVSIAYDSKRKQVCFIVNNQTKIYDYNDIIQSELEIDGETVLRQTASTMGILGRAVVGGVLAGGVGAIIGGATGSRTSKSKETIKSINLKITINDTSNPIYRINFLNFETKKGDWNYNHSYESAEQWHGKIAAIIKQTENNLSKKTLIPNSTADEILKLKELLDIDVLSKDEFESEKHKILSR